MQKDNNIKKTEKLNNILTMVVWIFFGSISIIAMIIATLTKTIVIAEKNTDSLDGVEQSLIESEQYTTYEDASGYENFEIKKGEEGTLTICFPKKIDSSSITIDNRYMDKCLWLSIKGKEKLEIDDLQVEGDTSKIISQMYLAEDGGLDLVFVMDSSYEFKNTCDGSKINIEICQMSDVYDFVVVVDPVVFGEEEFYDNLKNDSHYEDYTLSISQYLSEKTFDENIKLLFTRESAQAASNDSLLSLIKDTGADLYVGIELNSNTDESKYGICSFYNDKYFIPQIGNVFVADALTKNVTYETSNRANGLYMAKDDSILNSLTIPAACVDVGYVTNPSEANLIKEPSYREKIAEGIKDAVIEIYNAYKNGE